MKTRRTTDAMKRHAILISGNTPNMDYMFQHLINLAGAHLQVPVRMLTGERIDDDFTIDWSEKPADLIIKDINEGLEQAWHNASGEPIQGGIMDALNGVFDDDDEDD